MAGDPSQASGSVICLNIGGERFTTLRSTLTRYKDSMLAAMFSGRHHMEVDETGAYFIDRNGSYFSYILDFLRSDKLPSNAVALDVLTEARYYGLDELEDRMCVLPAVSSLIVIEKHRAQFPDYHEVKCKIIQIAMENATTSKVGRVIICAFREIFVPTHAKFDIHHSCTADEAHINVGPWEGMADEETFIRCLESDLIADGFDAKFDDGKRRCKYFYGHSCQKCVFRLQVTFG